MHITRNETKLKKIIILGLCLSYTIKNPTLPENVDPTFLEKYKNQSFLFSFLFFFTFKYINIMGSDKFDAIKVGTGEDLITLTRWVISQQQVKYTQKNVKMRVHSD